MSKIKILIPFILGSALIFGSGYFFWRLYDFFVNYNEAEPLVQIVWPMAGDVKDFVDANERRPVSLDELERQSATNLNELKDYKHSFFSEGPWIFHITVNKKYGFGIDEQFRPRWTGADPDTEPGEVVNYE